jgi:hypothetical protein
MQENLKSRDEKFLFFLNKLFLHNKVEVFFILLNDKVKILKEIK